MRKLEVFDKSTLVTLYKREITRNCEARFQHRMHCVLLVAHGCSCYQVAEWFGENPCTIQRYIHCYLKCGTEGLRGSLKTGRPRKLSNNQIEQLQSDFSIDPSNLGYDQDKWSGLLLKEHLALSYGIDLSVRQCQRILKQLLNNLSLDKVLKDKKMPHYFVAKKNKLS
jgi:transposase